MKHLKASELASFIKATPEVLLIDVRTPQEFNSGAIAGFINIPLDEIMNHTDELESSKTYVIMCHAGSRSLIATRMLENAGYHNLYNLSGGYASF